MECVLCNMRYKYRALFYHIICTRVARKVWRYQGGNEKGKTIQWPKEKGQTIIYKTLHRKLKIEQQVPH
jgi:hypothetical protein